MECSHLLLVHPKTRANGAFYGAVFAPSLFLLYKADCRNNDESSPRVKFADDTELVGKISNDNDALYHKQIGNFVNWYH